MIDKDKQPIKWRYIWYLSIALVIGTVVFIIILDKRSNSFRPIESVTVKSEPNSSLDSSLTNLQSWQYSEFEDKMTSGIQYYAQVEAKDLLHFDSPYEGGSTASMIIRNKNGINKIYVKISEGQFNLNSSSIRWRIRFDEAQPEKHLVIRANDGSSNIVFINYDLLINKLRSSKGMILEAEFYQEGLRLIEFNTSGLKWEH